MEKELQIKTIVKIVKSNLDYLNSKEYANKISFLLLKNDTDAQKKLKNISSLYNIINNAIKYENYKKALRYSCILKREVSHTCEDIKVTL